MERYDVIIVGGGIAGASLAMQITRHGRSVVMLEAEEQPGFHATGRSAAYFAPGYGNAVVRALTAASADFFQQPPAGFADVPLLRTRALIFVARSDQKDALQRSAQEAGAAVRILDADAAIARVQILRRDYVFQALLDERGGDIDVDALLQGYLRQMRKQGGAMKTNARVSAIRHDGSFWRAIAGDMEFAAPVIVNAAGPWADSVASLAGLPPLGLAPLRRTAITVAAPKDQNIETWPMTVDVEEAFYIKPEAGALLLSPADETPSPPCDAQAEEIDIAYAVDRIEQATTLRVTRISHRWAGLRTFAPDRTPVAGFDPRAPGFFWLAGQGGYGVQTAPALSTFAAGLITSVVQQPDLCAAMSPGRLI